MIRNLNAGAQVRFAHFDRGFELQKEDAQKYLDPKEIYTIKRVAFSEMFTRVWLDQIPWIEFNAIQFEDVLQ